MNKRPRTNMGAYFKSESNSFRNYLNKTSIQEPNNRILLSGLGTRVTNTILSKKQNN
jgi:hypothetical protein